jgi:REP element-mobilizing transposase RayT
MREFRKSSLSRNEFYKGQHRFEHWYLDNCVYFITSRCRDKMRCFASEAAKAVFWDRFEHYTHLYHFTPWATTLMDNHYHTIGYLRIGRELGPMMQKIHGSVAKLVNDQLPRRLVPFWYEQGKQGYFDGCIRDATQARRAYRYILRQAERAGIVRAWRDYPHTHVRVQLEPAIARANELNAFLEQVPYARYETRGE